MSDRFDHTLERKLESKAEEPGDPGLVRRIELITGTGRRRLWRNDEKARIIIESFKRGANVSEVARRNGLSPQQLFGWRRETRELLIESPAAVAAVPEPAAVAATSRKRGRSKTPAVEGATSDRALAFAPVVVATHAEVPPAPPSPPTPMTGHIEIAICDAVVRVIGQVELAHLTAVLRAIRRAS
jgi:transposase